MKGLFRKVQCQEIVIFRSQPWYDQMTNWNVEIWSQYLYLVLSKQNLLTRGKFQIDTDVSMLHTLQAACVCAEAEMPNSMSGWGVGGDEVVVIITADCPDLAHHHLAPPTHNLQITENTTRRQQRRINYQHILLQSSAILRHNLQITKNTTWH